MKITGQVILPAPAPTDGPYPTFNFGDAPCPVACHLMLSIPYGPPVEILSFEGGYGSFMVSLNLPSVTDFTHTSVNKIPPSLSVGNTRNQKGL